MNNRPKILVLSPTYTAGSWMVVEELLQIMKDDYEITSVGLGSGEGELKGIRQKHIPYPLFENFNPKYGSNVIINALYQLPLQVIGFLHVVLFRPRLVISNGFAPVLLSLPIAKLIGVPVFVYYGSYLTRVKKNPIFHFMFRLLNMFTSFVFVNSLGSAEDVTSFISEEKVYVLEHWTDMESVSEEDRVIIRSNFDVTEDDFVISYVGRFVEEKGVRALIDLIKGGNFGFTVKFWFVGNGKMLEEVEGLAREFENVFYRGFITDRSEIRNIYAASDILWTFADETYVARPGIEALAVGCPLMIPNSAAIIEKYLVGHKIREDLIPNSVGWIVDDNDLSSVRKLLSEIVSSHVVDESMRSECRKYAKLKHSKKNVEKAVEIIKSYV